MSQSNERVWLNLIPKEVLDKLTYDELFSIGVKIKEVLNKKDSIREMIQEDLKYAKEQLALRDALIVEKDKALAWYANDKNWDQETGCARDLIRQPNTVDGPGETVEEADFGYRAEKALSLTTEGIQSEIEVLKQENERLQVEAKMGNISYKQAIEIKNENASLREQLEKANSRIKELNALMDDWDKGTSLAVKESIRKDDLLKLAVEALGMARHFIFNDGHNPVLLERVDEALIKIKGGGE